VNFGLRHVSEIQNFESCKLHLLIIKKGRYKICLKSNLSENGYSASRRGINRQRKSSFETSGL
jgi:hypothetical protein